MLRFHPDRPELEGYMLKSDPTWLHVNIMDGNFVLNITFGPLVVKAVHKVITSHEVFFDCHMMVQNPQKWFVPMANAGAG